MTLHLVIKNDVGNQSNATMWCHEVQLWNASTPFSGYAEMEAQFAWDDKTIRRTFIRKVLEAK